MGRRTRNLTLTIAAISVTVAWPAAASAKQVCWPGVDVPTVHLPALTIPGKEIPGIDSQFSLALSIAYWRQTGDSSSVPSHAARGFGQVNAAGRVTNQYVRPYLRSNGTFVPGHWRYGKADGQRTCKIIRC